MELSTEIKEARRKLNLTQAEAAKAWGVSLGTVRAWEQGANKPRGLALEMLRQKIASSVEDKSVPPASSASASTPSPEAPPPRSPCVRQRKPRRSDPPPAA